MTRKLISALLSLATLYNPIIAQTPTSTQNYTMHRVMLDEAGTVGVTEVQYYDGLGRPTVAVSNANGNGTNFTYQLQEYDAKGRASKSWLPVAGSSSPDYMDASSLQSSALGRDGVPYSETVYDALDRPVESWGAGEAWRTAGRRVQTIRRANAANEVRRYTVNAAGHLTSSGFHPAGTLSVEEIVDEDNRTLKVYKNVAGLTLLERRSTDNNTYFVYNDLDQLQYVLSPMASASLSNGTWSIANNQTLRNYAYYYEYDSRGRCVKKKLPGCDAILYQYDKADRLVFSRDGVQQQNGTGTFYLYDHLGREVVRGICQSANFPNTPNLLARAFIEQGGTYAGYSTVLSLPSLVQLLQVNYYDTYAQIPDSAGYPFVAHEGYASQKADAHGLLTGKRVYLLGSPSVFYPTLYFYDNKGQAVLTRTRNFRRGINDTFTKYSFTGKPEKMHLIHRNGSQTVMHTEDFTYTYDGVDRPRKVMHSVDSNPAVKIAEYTYNNQGLVSRKETAGYSMTYDYNLRNWLTEVNASSFSEYLNYEDAPEGATPQYGGNISSLTWFASGLKGCSERGYTFAYDNLSRLTSSSYFSDYGDEDYEEQYAYDANGNINELYRNGISYDGTCRTVDDLVMYYSGNQLSKVYDNADDPDNHGLFHFWDGTDNDVEYQYDRNGNMTQDLNREISAITYNALNLPKKIQFEDNSYINNYYSAEGKKLQYAAWISNSWTMPIGNTSSTMTRYITEYCGNLEYRMTLGQPTKQYLHFDGGYITFEGSTPKYHFYVQDHLGNNRLVMSQTGQVEQEAQYYPSGAIMTDISTSLSLQPYLYSGKELDRMHGLDWYDYGARHYDAALLRWHTMDPLCEKYYHISPYVFCGNNFVNAFDPNGREWDYITDKDGNIHIKLDVKLVIDASLTESQIEAYKSSINAAFNSVLSSIDGGKYSGEITFNGNVIEGQVTPILTLGGINDPLQGGQTKSFYSDVNLLDSKGNLRSSMDVGYDAVHELFHTARLDHPFESTQSADVELVKGGSSSYLTTSNTNENILFNIMNYPQTVINGKSYRSLNSSKPQGMMTEGQAQFLLNEINLQKKGAGLSTQDPYWFIFPGIPVK